MMVAVTSAIRHRRDRKWRQLLLAAIDNAACAGLFVASSRADGLRTIRLFEQINGVSFDPANGYHRMLVTNGGWFFALQRLIARQRKGGVSAISTDLVSIVAGRGCGA